MNEYLFYTHEGYTQSPTGMEVENSQILGFVTATDIEEAREFLLEDNPWLKESGFNINEALVRIVSANL